ncbi:galactosyl transferase GMA12/MNN10 family-domain-containing protein, partial [Hyaloraphidium curvatum]
KAESLRNRLDFARLHGYRFHVEATVNPDVDGHWNKVALLHRALRLYPDVEWFFMSDIDSIVLHPHVPLPLNRYPPQADLVISGDPQKVYGKDPDTQHCLNSGVLLLRNTPWMRSFLDRQLAIARVFCGPTRDTDEVALKIKAFFGERYNKWIQDQTALVYLLNQLPTQDRAKVYWESQAFNSPDMWIGKGSRSSIYNRNESIFTAVHFSGCQFCYSKSNYLNDTDCFESWNAAWQKHLWLVRREDYLRLTRLGSVTWLDAQPGNLTT